MHASLFPKNDLEITLYNTSQYEREDKQQAVIDVALSLEENDIAIPGAYVIAKKMLELKSVEANNAFIRKVLK